MSRGKYNSHTRRMMMAAVDKCLLGGALARVSYHIGLQGNIRVVRHELRTREAGQLPRPLLLAFASDFHAGPTTHPEVFRSLVRELEAIQPDVLLLGGDYVCSKSKYIEVLCDSLRHCHPPLGIYGVLGNHDLWSGDEHITRRLAHVGVRVLINEGITLPHPFDSVSICGVDDPWTGDADIARTFENTASVRVFLTHSPDGILLLKDEQFDVGFAGHTHGGQIALPGGTPIVTAGGPLSRIYGRGRFDVPRHGPLIVSLGVGCSTIPFRVNADPELVVCTLVS